MSDLLLSQLRLYASKGMSVTFSAKKFISLAESHAKSARIEELEVIQGQVETWREQGVAFKEILDRLYYKNTERIKTLKEEV